MNASKVLALSALFGLMFTAAASAAVNNVTSSGHYVPMGTAQAATRSFSRQTFHAPSVRMSPIYSPTQPSAVAQASEAGRRFSYAPAPQVSATCNGTSAADAQVSVARRFSYAPTVAPVEQPTPRSYFSRPSYSHGNRNRANVERWALPKTDPRKFND